MKVKNRTLFYRNFKKYMGSVAVKGIQKIFEFVCPSKLGRDIIWVEIYAPTDDTSVEKFGSWQSDLERKSAILSKEMEKKN